MFKTPAQESTPHWHIFNWFLLCFNGGCINAGGFFATGSFVSHITGFATLFGVEAIHQRYDIALGLLSVPLFFLFGAFLAGLFIDLPAHQNKKPNFDFVMGLCALLLFIASCDFTHLKKFGETLRLKQDYFLLAQLCLACGLQNGAITSSSRGLIRTTHLTGLTTDLGLGIARLLAFNLKKEPYRKELWTNRLRFGSIVSYILGSAIGGIGFTFFEFRGFLLPCAISLYATYQGYKTKKMYRDHSHTEGIQ